MRLFQPWTTIDRIEAEARRTIADLQRSAARWVDVEFDQTLPL